MASAVFLFAASAWPLPLLGATVLLTLNSAARAVWAEKWRRSQDSAAKIRRGRGVVFLACISGALSLMVMGIALSRLHEVHGRLSVVGAVGGVVALFFWAFLTTRAVRIAIEIEMPPIMRRGRTRTELDAASEAFDPGGSAAKGPLLGVPGQIGPSRGLTYLLRLAVLALVVSTGVPPVEPVENLALTISRYFGHDDGPRSNAGRGAEPEDEPDPSFPDATVAAPSGVQVDPNSSPSAAEVTAAEFCHYDPAGVFRDEAPPTIAAGLERAYYEQGGGAGEIGCPDDAVEVMRGLYVAELSRGESDPSLLISDLRGVTGVVFDDLVPYARRLLERGVLASVRPRVSTGSGDFQVFKKTSQACVLALRNVYGPDGYVVLPASVSHAAMRLSVLQEAFPHVEELDVSSDLVGRGRFRLSWSETVDGSSISEHVTMTKRSAPHVLRGVAGEVVHGDKCPRLSAFDALALAAKRRFEAESGGI